MKYHLGTAVVAAPQILIGDYLIEKSKKNDAIKSAMDRMFGDNRSKGQRYYNNKILNLVKMKTSYPDIFFHIGKGDFHYEQHFQPFWKECLRNDITIELNVQDYSDHSLTGTYFQPYLLKKLENLLP
ncbi:Two component regulator three Y domain-containing protein [Listeria grandensis FSL F6-0971]|uniref:Two component regulator three Y domain-containing protein n=1 Tax=Listeria grandensis FSL F6-0971 TaxID=1265819 RepID=W7BFK3_9LIST|nr:Two component regulator three Y domain-containing protein [Listeria grandensis FSL F6-0971]